MNIPYALFSHPDYDHHERVLFFHDEISGVKGIIAVHNTHLGPSLGGCRMWPYATEHEAIRDALRLSRGMTYKAALANLALGGGKAVLIANPKTDKSPALFQALAEAVNELGGKYITAEDVGTSVADMQIVRQHTTHVVGLPLKPEEDDGDPSHYTAYGVYQGILASVKHRFQTDGVAGLTIAVQGLGSVGMKVCRLLHENGARLIVTDIDPDNLVRARDELEAHLVRPEEIYSAQADVFSPCALGGILNDDSIPQLKVGAVAGGANNQLYANHHAVQLMNKDILYAPDYVINAGGLIKVSYEGKDFHRQDVLSHVEQIYATLLEIFREADNDQILPYQAADLIAEKRFHKMI